MVSLLILRPFGPRRDATAPTRSEAAQNRREDHPRHRAMATSHMNTTGRRERTDVHVRAVDRRRPPEREPPVRDLVQAAPLGVRQLFVLHGLLETRSFFPEEALPRREVGT